MPFPRSQLDIIVVSSADDGVISFECLQMLQTKWEHLGILTHSNLTPLGREYLGLGDIKQIRFEYSEKHRLYANHQGGYRVYCPNCTALCTSEFVASIGLWRREASSPHLVHLACPNCSHRSPLPRLIGRPKFAFAKGVVVISGVDSIDFSVDALVDIQEELGPIEFVYRRVG